MKIVRPERISRYWQTFDPNEFVEQKQLFEDLKPKYNRLIVFNPRLPHGVRGVRGTKDIAKGRVVLNDWLNEPSISCIDELSLDDDDTRNVLDAKSEELYDVLDKLPAMIGFAALKLEVSESGVVESTSWGIDMVEPLIALETAEEVTETRDIVLATCM